MLVILKGNEAIYSKIVNIDALWSSNSNSHHLLLISIPKYTEGGGHRSIFIAALFSYYCKQLKSSSIRKQLNNVAQSVYGINEVSKGNSFTYVKITTKSKPIKKKLLKRNQCQATVRHTHTSAPLNIFFKY